MRRPPDREGPWGRRIEPPVVRWADRPKTGARARSRIWTFLLELAPISGCAVPSVEGRIAAAESAMAERREARKGIAPIDSRLASERERAETAWTPPEERRRIREDERRLVELRREPRLLDPAASPPARREALAARKDAEENLRRLRAGRKGPDPLAGD